MTIYCHNKRTRGLHGLLPSFGEQNGEKVAQNLLLVGDVLHNVPSPVHEVPNLVARRRAVDVPLELLFHLLAQHPLQTT